MIHTVQQLQEKYDAYYKKNPNKWASDARNGFAFVAISNYLAGEPPINCLDVGCGVGHTLEYFHKRWPDVFYYGMDLSPEAIRIAATRVKSGRFHCGPLADENPFGHQFDLLLCLGVMEHFEDLEDDLRRVKKLIAPGGICYTEIPNCIAYETSEKKEGFREVNQGNHQYEWHLYRPTWDGLFLDAGFEIVDALQGPGITTEFCYLLR